jgi:hypothetical protein
MQLMGHDIMYSMYRLESNQESTHILYIMKAIDHQKAHDDNSL